MPHEFTEEEEFARLTLEEMGPQGDTFSHYGDEAISVFGGIPDEEVVARVIRYKRQRQRHVSAVVTEVLKPSPHRVAPPCPYFGPCSGCQWQHIEYAHQLSLKQAAVEKELRRYALLEDTPVSPPIPSPQPYNYRNHARFTVRARGSIGYVNRVTRRFVRVDQCMLLAPQMNEALGQLQGRCQETTQLSIRYGVNTAECVIQPTLRNPEILLPSGQSHYRELILGHPFLIASPSFFQVNTAQAERLVELVRARLELTGSEVLVDAYAGVGTFAVIFAPLARRVISIEESPAAVRDAATNGRGIENIQFIQGRTEEVLENLDERPDAVILDPPRAGCHPDAIRALLQRAPRRVIYVSCDPATLARDLHLLVQGGFRVKAVEPVDMFPQTYHVECVATLRSKG